MSFLTPLYILGALTVAAPILFHLIRRTTKGEVPFSSLIFLSPSPPKLTRRSRLDRWFLLLLRATALILLAAAFARPFLRQAAGLNLGDSERRRVAVLIDSSASMRRGDLWRKVKARAVEAVEACGPDDELAVYAFDASARPVFGFEESKAVDPPRRRTLARSRVEGLAPTWGATNLGRALIDAAGAIEDVGDGAGKTPRLKRRIVLISDLQQGSRLDELGEFEWPSDLDLELKTVAVEGSNAGLQRLPQADESGPLAPGGSVDDLRVRISNDATSKTEAFTLAWAGTQAPPIPAYVPPGESRVVRVPRPADDAASRSLKLGGDSHEFDDVLYLAAQPRETSTVLYIGPDAPDDASGLCYFLARAYEDSPRRILKVQPRPPTDPLTIEPGRKVPLVVLASEVPAATVDVLRRFAEAGGTVLVVAAPGPAPTLAALAGVPSLEVEETPSRGDAMLTEIAFDHPLFAPFAAPQFNDFTKIKFWKHRKIPTEPFGEARVVARFEGGDPAVIEKALGKGRLVVFASGWSPADSQLARSTKFVPLMAAMLDGPNAGAELPADRIVGEAVPLPEGATAVRTPGGTTDRLAAGAATFDATDAPGIYEVQAASGPREFAVNLDPSETKTAPLEVETLERLGVRLAADAAREEADREATRQMQNAELEGRQKLWRPLILAVIGVLILETWLAGRPDRPRPNVAEGPAS